MNATSLNICFGIVSAICIFVFTYHIVMQISYPEKLAKQFRQKAPYSSQEPEIYKVMRGIYWSVVFVGCFISIWAVISLPLHIIWNDNFLNGPNDAVGIFFITIYPSVWLLTKLEKLSTRN